MNNRIIKFRIWDKSRKEMTYGDWNITFNDKNHEHPITIHGFNRDNPENFNFKIQQFTGLLDKNNREIYEGDILTGNCLLNPGQDNVICRVEYNNKETCFNIIGKPLNTSGSFRNYLYMLKKNIEIIGNIFENPELLNS